MFDTPPIWQSPGARKLLFATLAITLGVMELANNVPSGLAIELTPIFKRLFTVGDYGASRCMLLIIAIGACSPIKFSVLPFLRWIGLHPIPVAIAASTVLGSGSLVVYLDSRLSMDEYAQFFQSQVFASGHLYGQFPVALIDWLIPVGFQNHFFDVSKTNGAVASAYWPSFALLLTPFTRIGVPWLCNPLLSGATVLAIHRLAQRLFMNSESAGLAVLLTVASPVFFADGISYYSMTAHLLANAVFALMMIEPTPRRAFAAGLVGSVALTLHNPVPHMLFAFPWIISLLRQRGKLRVVLLLFAGYLPLCACLGFGWFYYLSQLAHEGTAIGSSGHGLDDSLSQVYSVLVLPTNAVWLARLIGIAKLWAWSVPGLILLALYGGWKWWHHRYCRLLCASALLTLVLFVLVPVDQGHGWGYRYFHSAWLVLPILGAAAFTQNPSSTEQSQLTDDPGAIRFVVACTLLTMVFGIGVRALQMRTFIAEHESHVPQYAGTEQRVVILNPTSAFYGLDLVQNDPWLRDGVIRMVTHGVEADRQMMHRNFAALHLVYADNYGSVWSAK